MRSIGRADRESLFFILRVVATRWRFDAKCKTQLRLTSCLSCRQHENQAPLPSGEPARSDIALARGERPWPREEDRRNDGHGEVELLALPPEEELRDAVHLIVVSAVGEGQELRQKFRQPRPRNLNQRKKVERKCLLYLVPHFDVLFSRPSNLKLRPSVTKHSRIFPRMISKTSST